MHFLELMLAMIGFHISAIHAAPTELPTVVIARSQTRGLPLCGQYYTTGPRPEQEPFSLVAGHAYHNVEDGFHIAGVMNHWCSLCTVWAERDLKGRVVWQGGPKVNWNDDNYLKDGSGQSSYCY